MKRKDEYFNLLPNRFKVIGVIVVVIAILLIVVMKDIISMAPAYTKLIKDGIFNLFILGLFFIALAKDKFEDEMTLLVKTKSFARAFVLSVLYVVIQPIVNLIIKYPSTDFTAQGLILTVLFIYLFTYYLEKFTGIK